MKAVSIFLILVFFCFNSYADQWLVFNASDINLSDNSTTKSPTGHAFVSFVKTNPKLKQTIIVGSWGFYPKSFGFGYIDSEFIDDTYRDKDASFVLKVSQEQFDQALAVKHEWETKKYKFTAQNCVNFVHAIAGIINNVQLPKETFTFPKIYINELKRLNADIEATDFSTPANPPVVPPNVNPVSAALIALFDKAEYYTKLSLANNDKTNILALLDIKFVLDKNEFFDKDDIKSEYPLSLEVKIIDLNNDGKLEVFVNMYNSDYYGQRGVEIGFGKSSAGVYKPIFKENGFIVLLTTSYNSYPDLLLGGPGMNAPTYRWDGSTYKFYRQVSFSNTSAPKMLEFGDYYLLQEKK